MVPVALIEHQLPGRVRLRVASKRGDMPFFEKVVRELSKHPSLHKLTANPVTGSMVLYYCEPLKSITTAAVSQKLFKTRRREPQNDKNNSKHPSALRQGYWLAGGIATGLSGLGLFQVAQGNALGSATENLWHAFGAHRMLGRSDIAVVFGALGIYQLLTGQLFSPASSLLFYALMLRQITAVEQARGDGLLQLPEPRRNASSANDSAAEAAAGTAGSLLDRAAH